MDEEALTPEEAAWIVVNRGQLCESVGAVIGPLAGQEAVKLLKEVFGKSGETEHE